MSKEITPPAPKPTLEEVCNRFETWRRHKKLGGRIPKGLWQAAVELCRDHSVFQVSRALRLSYSDLKDRVQRAKGIAVAPGEHGCGFGFVELDLGASIKSSQCVVEMEAPNGRR